MANPRDRRQLAEAQFHQTIKKAQAATEAVSQSEVDSRAVREKTERLRALRLAKEAAAAKDAAEKPPEIAKKRPTKAVRPIKKSA